MEAPTPVEADKLRDYGIRLVPDRNHNCLKTNKTGRLFKADLFTLL